jgi:hypothetical protein
MGARSKERANSLKQWLKGQNHPQQAIVTCRAENYHELELGITTVLVEELDEEKIRVFAKNYLGEKADGFLKRVLSLFAWGKRGERHPFRLAHNPFMLRALTMIYTALPDGDLPSNTGVVFQNLIRVLWQREKERKTSHWIAYDKMLVAMSTLAFSMLEDGLATTVPLEYAQKYVSLSVLQVADSANIVKIDAGFVGFYHQSMQEYLAAAYVVSNIEYGALAICLAHLTDYQWHETLFMAASLPDTAAVFFERFLDEVDELIIQDKEIISLLTWANMKTNLAQQQAHKPAAVRSWYIWYALDRDPYLDFAHTHIRDIALDRARTHARARVKDVALVLGLDLDLDPDIDLYLDIALNLDRGRIRDIALDRARTRARARANDLALALNLSHLASQELNLPDLHEALTLLQLPDVEDSDPQWRDFAQSLETILAKNRQFHKWNFSETELENLSTYLQATLFLVYCFNVAKVSNRQEIENRLLLPPT